MVNYFGLDSGAARKLKRADYSKVKKLQYVRRKEQSQINIRMMQVILITKDIKQLTRRSH
jgi:hypothetical protein